LDTVLELWWDWIVIIISGKRKVKEKENFIHMVSVICVRIIFENGRKETTGKTKA
jgi:hypothetical protein